MKKLAVSFLAPAMLLAACSKVPAMPSEQSLPDARVIVDGEVYLIENASCEIVPEPRHHLTEQEHSVIVNCWRSQWYIGAFDADWRPVTDKWADPVFVAAGDIVVVVQLIP